GAIAPVRIQGITNPYFPVMARNIPLGRVGPVDLQNLSIAIRSLKIIDIFGKFVNSIPAGRGTAHPYRKDPRFQIEEYGGIPASWCTAFSKETSYWMDWACRFAVRTRIKKLKKIF